MTTREEIADWIDGQIRAGEAPARRLTLARVNSMGGETGHPLLQVRCTETDTGEALAQRIHDKALATARGMRLEGVTFTVQSWTTEGPKESFTFRIGVEDTDDLTVSTGAEVVAGPFTNSNPAAALGSTLANVHGQGLRHQEVMFRLTMQGLAQSQKALLDQNRMLQEQNQALLRKHQQLLMLVEKLHDRSNERALAIRAQELHEKRKDEILQMITPLVPIVMSRVLGAAGFDAALSAGGDPMLAEMLRGLFATVTPEQLAQMIAPLHPEQAAVVIEILKRFSGEAASRQASVDRAVSAQTRQESSAPPRERGDIMVVNQRRYERLHYLFATFRHEQLDALQDVLDRSQWLEFMALYKQMSEEAEADAAEPPIPKAR